MSAFVPEIQRGTTAPADAFPRRVLAAEATMGAILLAAGVLLLIAGRHLTFFFDEWDFILGRRGESVATYLDPHNGHLQLFPVAVYKLLLAFVGLRHYWPYQVVEIILHLLCGGLVYVIARRRVGAWAAIAPSTLLLFMGSAYEDLLWPFQIGFLASVAGGLGCLALLDRPVNRHDAGACALLLWSLSASAVGIPFLLAAATMLIVQRAPPRRFWIVAVPALLFVIWYIGWGGSEGSSLQAVLSAPQFVTDAASAATAGIAGFSLTYGPALAVVVLLALWARRRSAHHSPLSIAVAVGALSFWGLSAVARADSASPAASRYLYVGACFILLLLVDAATDAVASRRVSLLLAAIVLAAVVSNLGLLRTGERSFRAVDQTLRVSLTALDVAAPAVSPTFQPDSQGDPQIQAGPFLSASRAFGSPGLTLMQLEREPASLRETADQILEQAERLALSPVGARTQSSPIRALDSQRGRLITRGQCSVFTPTGTGAFLDLEVMPGAGLRISPLAGSTDSVYLARLAAAFAEPVFGQLSQTSELRFPVDAQPSLPWRVRLTSSFPFAVCALP
jgi:hypothetical protein